MSADTAAYLRWEVPVARNPTLPIYVAAGCIFAALAVRAFALPLRVNELGGDKVEIGLLFSVGTVTAAGLSLPAGVLADRFRKRTPLPLSIGIGGGWPGGVGLGQAGPPPVPWRAAGGG